MMDSSYGGLTYLFFHIDCLAPLTGPLYRANLYNIILRSLCTARLALETRTSGSVQRKPSSMPLALCVYNRLLCGANMPT